MANIQDLHQKMNMQHLANIEAVRSNRITDSYYGVVAKEDALHSLDEKGVQAGIMNNFRKVVDSFTGTGEGLVPNGASVTHANNYGPYVMEVWPVVVAWYPEFPLKDLVCVQDMDKPLAYLFFSKLLASKDKAGQKFGDAVETPLGVRTIKGSYPTGEVMGEVIEGDALIKATGVTKALLAYAPLKTISTATNFLGKVKLECYAGTTLWGTLKATTVNAGVISLDGGTSKTGTIEVSTGEVSVSNDTITKIVASYVWDIDYATVDNLPTVKEDIELVSMEAQPRALGFEWTIFSEYLKKSQFGVDIREENTKRILNLLYQYQVRYVLDEMYNYAEGNGGAAIDITIPSGNTYSLDVKASKVAQQLKAVANKVELASGRMEGNRIVVGSDFKAFLESLPNNWYQPSSSENAFSGPREIGTFATNIKVFYDPSQDANAGFMTYKGSEWYDAAYYIGSFMPCVPTDAVALAVTVRSSFCSMEAYKYHKPTCVFKLTFTEQNA